MTVLAIVAIWAGGALLLGTIERGEVSLFERVSDRIRRWFCGWGSHEYMRVWQCDENGERIFLLCINCGAETPGFKGKGRA